MNPTSWTLHKVARLQGALRPPSDKSITHRAYLLSALAEPGIPCVVRDPLQGEDCLSTLRCLEEFGVEIDEIPAAEAAGNPITLLMPPPRFAAENALCDCGNSGTLMRLLSGLIAGHPHATATLTGDESLQRRPMKRVLDPLREMGAIIEGDQAPFTLSGRRLKGIHHVSPVASAQVKSAILLAGLHAEGETWVTEPSLSRDHTERFLEGLGVELLREGLSVGIRGLAPKERLPNFEIEVPADISSAAFFLVGAALIPFSRITLNHVGVNPTRSGILEVLEAAGAKITLGHLRDNNGEPVAELSVEGGEPLRAFTIEGDLVPRLMDEIPVLAVLATQCEGTTRIRNAEELRVKESDRIATTVAMLKAFGANVTEHPDGMDITGPTPLTGTRIEANLDHRIAMSAAIAALISTDPTTIFGVETVATSYPNFLADLQSLIE